VGGISGGRVGEGKVSESEKCIGGADGFNQASAMVLDSYGFLVAFDN